MEKNIIKIQFKNKLVPNGLGCLIAGDAMSLTIFVAGSSWIIIGCCLVGVGSLYISLSGSQKDSLNLTVLGLVDEFFSVNFLNAPIECLGSILQMPPPFRAAWPLVR